MLKDIKDILLKEIKYEIDEYYDAKKRIEEIDSKIDEIDSKMRGNLPLENGEYLECPDRPKSLMKRFSFFEKYFFKRREYSEAKKMQSKYENEFNIFDKKSKELQDILNKLYVEKNRLEAICKDKESIREKYEKIRDARYLRDLGLTYDQAAEFLKQNGIEPVLDESDKAITPNESEFDSVDDFILVHKTHYEPRGGIVRSSSYNGGTEKDTVYFGDDEFSIEYKKARNTIHFCQNGEVSSHEYGDFEKRKYVVLIPLKDIERKEIISFCPQDTFFDEKVEIRNGYILCPQNEIEQMKKINPTTKIIGYDGDFVDGYADAFISMLGYKTEPIGKDSWCSREDQEKQRKFKESYFGERKSLPHAYTKEYARDKLLDDYYKILGFITSLQKYKEEGKIYDTDTLTYELFNQKNIASFETEKQKIEGVKNFSGIGPFITRFLNNGHYNYKKNSDVSIKDYIQEEYSDDKEYSIQSNLNFLLYKLKKDFNIEFSPNFLEILQLGYFDKDYVYNNLPLKDLYDRISDEDTKKLIEKMCEDRCLHSINDIIDALFTKEIIEQVYREKELPEKENRETHPDEEGR